MDCTFKYFIISPIKLKQKKKTFREKIFKLPCIYSILTEEKFSSELYTLIRNFIKFSIMKGQLKQVYRVKHLVCP